jgi:hypothetical protein
MTREPRRVGNTPPALSLRTVTTTLQAFRMPQAKNIDIAYNDLG